MGAWVAAKAGMAVLIDHGMTTMGSLKVMVGIRFCDNDRNSTSFHLG